MSCPLCRYFFPKTWNFPGLRAGSLQEGSPQLPTAPRVMLCILDGAKDLGHSLSSSDQWVVQKHLSCGKYSLLQNKQKQTLCRAPRSSCLSWFSVLFCSFFPNQLLSSLNQGVLKPAPCSHHFIKSQPPIRLPITWAALSPQLQISDLINSFQSFPSQWFPH